MEKIKDKQRILKAAGENQLVVYQETLIILSADFSAETLQARRDWHNIFEVMMGKNLPPRIFNLARQLFRFERETEVYRQAKAKRIQHH